MSDWTCGACRDGRHRSCDRLRGCECALLLVDGALALCPALLDEQP